MRRNEHREAVSSRVARFARVLGAILILGGAGHVAGVSALVIRQGAPPRDRLSFLAFVALAHWSAGALNLLSASMLRVGDPFARAAMAIALGIIGGWAAIQLPAFLHHPTVISSGPLVYLVAQIALLSAAHTGTRYNPPNVA